MDKKKIARELLKLATILSADTFKCPECGTKVLEQTGYCVKCKKKVKKGAEKVVLTAPQKKKQQAVSTKTINKLNEALDSVDGLNNLLETFGLPSVSKKYQKKITEVVQAILSIRVIINTTKK